MVTDDRSDSPDLPSACGALLSEDSLLVNAENFFITTRVFNISLLSHSLGTFVSTPPSHEGERRTLETY